MSLEFIAEDIAPSIMQKYMPAIMLMHKNEPVAVINRKTGVAGIVNRYLMPLNLFLEVNDDIDTRVQNISNFEYWCADRLLTVRRTYYKEIVNACGFTQNTTDRQRAEVALQCRCLSLQDQYWVRGINEEVRWEAVNLFNNSLNDAFIDVCLRGRSMSISDISPVMANVTVDGVVNKAWRRHIDGFYLLKAGSAEQVLREIEASNALQQMGFDTVSYIHSMYAGCPITMCKSFTDENIGFVTAEAYGYNNDLNVITDMFMLQFLRLVLSEYLIGNSDLHARNWGFLRKDGTIISMAPLFDFDHAFELELDNPNIESKVWRTLGKKYSLKNAAKDACRSLRLGKSDFEGIKNSYSRYAVELLFM